MKRIKFSRVDEEYSYSDEVFYSSQSYHEILLPQMDTKHKKQSQRQQMKKEIIELHQQGSLKDISPSNKPQNILIPQSNDENIKSIKDISGNLNKKVATRHRSKSEEGPTRSKSRNTGSRKTSKNQYDKNIFANITKVIIKKIANRESKELIDNYCEAMRMNSAQFYDIFVKMDRQDFRMGTSELSSFLNSNEYKPEIKLLFSYFLVNFLKEDYLAYVILHGKMKDKEKYTRCATKMMYIPQLSECDYWLIFELGKSQPS